MAVINELFLKGKSLLEEFPQPSLESKVLLMHAARLREEEFFANPEKELPGTQERRFFRLVEKRRAGFPLAYLTGCKEFWSIPLKTSRGVSIPRPETELVVEKVVELSSRDDELNTTRGKYRNVERNGIPKILLKKEKTKRDRKKYGDGETDKISAVQPSREVIIVELGTGSGNIAIALAKELPHARIFATDVSKKALKLARLNASEKNVENITFVCGSLFSPLRKLNLGREDNSKNYLTRKNDLKSCVAGKDDSGRRVSERGDVNSFTAQKAGSERRVPGRGDLNNFAALKVDSDRRAPGEGEVNKCEPGRCDFIVSNPPYVSEAEWKSLPGEIKYHEPKKALVAGETGLEIIEKIIKDAPPFLKPGGFLILEIGSSQKDEVLSLFDSSWKEITLSEDLSGIPRVAVARSG